MNVQHRGTLSREDKSSIEDKTARAFLEAIAAGHLDEIGDCIEVEGITNVDDEEVIQYLERLGYNAMYKPIEEQCLGTYSDDCQYPIRHIFELSKIE